MDDAWDAWRVCREDTRGAGAGRRHTFQPVDQRHGGAWRSISYLFVHSAVTYIRSKNRGWGEGEGPQGNYLLHQLTKPRIPDRGTAGAFFMACSNVRGLVSWSYHFITIAQLNVSYGNRSEITREFLEDGPRGFESSYHSLCPPHPAMHFNKVVWGQWPDRNMLAARCRQPFRHPRPRPLIRKKALIVFCI